MTMHERVSGVWKEMTEAFVNVSGTEKRILEGYERVSGVWKQFFSAVTLALSGGTASHSVSNGNQATALIRVDTDFNIYKIEGVTVTQLASSTDWKRPASGSSSDYEVSYVLSGLGSDPLDVGGAASTWLTISVDRSFGYQHSANDTEHVGSFTLKIRIIGDAASEVSGVYSCTARVGLPP